MNRSQITIISKAKRSKLFSTAGVWCLYVLALVLILNHARAEENSAWGPLLDRFQLTLDAGTRTEAAGPFFYSQQKDTEATWALPPFYSCDRDPAVAAHEDDWLYPFVSTIRYGQEHRWQIFQLLSFSGGAEQTGATKERVTLFPFYFSQRSADTNLNYTAVVPFYGQLKNRLFHDDIFFVLFPFYSETRKRDVVTDNYFYPFGATRHGDGLRGWQIWPFAGHEHKDVTTRTNGFGDATLVAGHDKSFYLWPLHLRQDTGIGTTNAQQLRASIPFYVRTRSPQRDSTSVLWPMFTWLDNREKNYREWDGPWPFVIFARGEGKTTSRVWPLFSEAHNATTESDSYVWPVWQFRRFQGETLDQRRTQVLFYLYSRLAEKNTTTGKEKVRLDMWPFFEWHRDFAGSEKLQVLALAEPFVPDNRGIERNWSPLWSVWRAEDNARTGASSRSLLWNLYRRETAPAHKKTSLLFGLFQYQCERETEQTRWFYFYRITGRPVTP